MYYRHTKAGFTLVELIVVIAILAILAGVAVPVYSGYIAKANEAGDLQLLGAVNTAFASACAAHGVDPTRVVGLATLSGEAGSMKIESVNVSGNGLTALSASGSTLNESFMHFFGDNANSTFKVYTSLGYDRANGVFVDGAKEVTVMYNGKPVTVTMEQLTRFNASTFGDIATEDLMNSVGQVVAGASTFLNGNWPVSALDSKFMLNGALGSYLSDVLNMDDEQIAAMTDTQIANALVLLAANGSKDLDAETLLSAYDATSKTWNMSGIDMITNMTIPYALAMSYANTDDASFGGQIVLSGNNALTQARKAMFERDYGRPYNTSDQAAGVSLDSLYTLDDVTAYYTELYGGSDYVSVKTTQGRTLQKVTITVNPNEKSSSEFINGLTSGMDDKDKLGALMNIVYSNDGFNSYMQSSQAVADMDGFLSAMSMIDENVRSGNVDANNLLNNGFTDPTLITMLQAILGY